MKEASDASPLLEYSIITRIVRNCLLKSGSFCDPNNQATLAQNLDVIIWDLSQGDLD